MPEKSHWVECEKPDSAHENLILFFLSSCTTIWDSKWHKQINFLLNDTALADFSSVLNIRNDSEKWAYTKLASNPGHFNCSVSGGIRKRYWILWCLILRLHFACSPSWAAAECISANCKVWKQQQTFKLSESSETRTEYNIIIYRMHSMNVN